MDSGAVIDGSSPHAHNIRGVATSAFFFFSFFFFFFFTRDWLVSKELEVATWKLNPVFASFYL